MLVVHPAHAPVRVIWLPGAALPARHLPAGRVVMAAPSRGWILPTHPMHNALRRGLLSPLRTYEERVRVREDGRLRTFEVQVGFQLPASEALPAKKDAALLKTHLDLLNQAYQAGGDRPAFTYDLPAALQRLGYKRQRHGAFHTRSLAEHHRRLMALAAHRLRVRGGAEAPLWIVTPLEAPAGRTPLRVRLEPGPWWEEVALARYRFHVPEALLALPTAGKGHEVSRIALQLAAELAVWERTQAKHGAGTIHRSVGALLAHAGVATLEELQASSDTNVPRRLRQYLAGEGFSDEGALARLRGEGGFDIDIADEAEFWASGRGWLERFWHARLRIRVRPLEAPRPEAG